MSVETWRARYPVFEDREFKNLSLRELTSNLKEREDRPFIWSARLSTGLFGLVSCPAGNSPHAPKGENEVIIALGDDGLAFLIGLGFLPCPTCHPENTQDFWQKAEDDIIWNYPELDDAKGILDRNKIPFDAMHVSWEVLAPYLSKMPNRIYTKPGLDDITLQDFKRRIEGLGFDLPPIGYYDHNSPTRFTEYNIK